MPKRKFLSRQSFQAKDPKRKSPSDSFQATVRKPKFPSESPQAYACMCQLTHEALRTKVIERSHTKSLPAEMSKRRLLIESCQPKIRKRTSACDNFQAKELPAGWRACALATSRAYKGRVLAPIAFFKFQWFFCDFNAASWASSVTFCWRVAGHRLTC